MSEDEGEIRTRAGSEVETKGAQATARRVKRERFNVNPFFRVPSPGCPSAFTSRFFLDADRNINGGEAYKHPPQGLSLTASLSLPLSRPGPPPPPPPPPPPGPAPLLSLVFFSLASFMRVSVTPTRLKTICRRKWQLERRSMRERGKEAEKERERKEKRERWMRRRWRGRIAKIRRSEIR